MRSGTSKDRAHVRIDHRLRPQDRLAAPEQSSQIGDMHDSARQQQVLSWRMRRRHRTAGAEAPRIGPRRPRIATARNLLAVIERPTRRRRCSHRSRAPFPSIASNTGARSPGEELMTCNTSAVAVCCSSASRVSVDQPRVLHRDDRLRREVLQQRDLLVGERADFLSVNVIAPSSSVVFAQRHDRSVRAPPRSTSRPARRIAGR